MWAARSAGPLPTGALAMTPRPAAVRWPWESTSASGMRHMVVGGPASVNGYTPGMAFETTATRLWKRLTREERITAATCFWREPPESMVGSALGAIVKARRMRPQAARALPDEARASALAGVLEPGEPLAASLLVALHLGSRRPLLAAFLDALGLPHDNGVLREEEGEAPPPSAEATARAAAAVSAFPRHEVETYFNTLWLQDPERWAPLETTSLS
jgi:hypothetical protein